MDELDGELVEDDEAVELLLDELEGELVEEEELLEDGLAEELLLDDEPLGDEVELLGDELLDELEGELAEEEELLLEDELEGPLAEDEELLLIDELELLLIGGGGVLDEELLDEELELLGGKLLDGLDEELDGGTVLVKLELDGDELDGDELDGDELDGDELDGDEPELLVELDDGSSGISEELLGNEAMISTSHSQRERDCGPCEKSLIQD